jgi:hypothetical protein
MDTFGGNTNLVEKWEPALEGIQDDYVRRTTAQLLENQAKQIVSEKINEAGVTTGATTVGQLGTFQKFAFPLVRRVYPELIANKIVGVQPMQGPVSQIFYLGNSRVSGSSQQTVYSKYKMTYRGLNNEKIGSMGGINAAYPAGQEGQHGNLTMESALAGGSGLEVDVDPNFSTSSVLQASAGGTSATFGGKVASFPNADTIMGWTVSGGERLTGTGIPELQFHIQQQAVVAGTRKMRALWTLEASQDLKAYHNLDLERELTDLLSKELSLEIDREILEDLRMLGYGFNGTDTMGNWRASQLDNGNPNSFQDTDRVGPHATTGYGGSVVEDIDGFVPSAFTYDQASELAEGSEGAGSSRTTIDSNVFVMDFTQSSLSFSPRHIGETYANLLALLNLASQDIYRTTHRGPGTVLITSPLIAALLESSAKLEGGIESADKPTNMGNSIEYKGKFAGKYDLYVDPLWPEDEILMGYKGSNAMDSGYVYSPYIPLQQLPTIVDPDSFQPRKGILTRYGKAAITPAHRFYRIIRIVGPNANYLVSPFARNAFVATADHGGMTAPGGAVTGYGK